MLEQCKKKIIFYPDEIMIIADILSLNQLYQLSQVLGEFGLVHILENMGAWSIVRHNEPSLKIELNVFTSIITLRDLILSV